MGPQFVWYHLFYEMLGNCFPGRLGQTVLPSGAQLMNQGRFHSLSVGNPHYVKE